MQKRPSQRSTGTIFRMPRHKHPQLCANTAARSLNIRKRKHFHPAIIPFFLAPHCKRIEGEQKVNVDGDARILAM